MKLFFSGIGGAGVSAIASFMADKGHTVLGSDRSFDTDKNHPAYRPLVNNGVKIVPQDGAGIDSSLDQIIFSTAVEKDLPEPKKALALGITVKTRPEFLAELVAAHKTFAIAGTSGKSTTSGLLAYMMRELGLQPNFIGGGRVSQFKSPRNLGNALSGSSEFLVVEACESDGSITSYKPEYSVILNLDFDHHSIEKTAEMFLILAKNTAKKVLINADDEYLRNLSLPEAISFSLDRPSRYRAENIQLKPLSSEFTVHGTRFVLNLPGRYNVYNALACLATLAEHGVPLASCVKPLETFQGIERRFDVHLNDSRGIVIDDYAHNPHKIASMMQMTSRIRGEITYVYQPHGFAPTRMMKKEYIEAFAKNLRSKDKLILLPIFYVGGTVAKDISSKDLADGVKADGKNAEVAGREELLSQVKSGECYVVFGARDESLSYFSEAIARKMKGLSAQPGLSASAEA